MMGFRRRASVLAAAMAWIMALGSLLGGLALARSLPQAHAVALAHSALCVSDETGGPAGDAAGHAAGCPLCLVPSWGQALSPPNRAIGAIAPRAASPAIFTATLTAPLGGAAETVAKARAPPRD